MARIQSLRHELADLLNLKTVTGAYSDISSLKITALRESFEKNTIFYEQISQLYHSVRMSAIMNKYIKEKKPAPNLRPKTIRVALTSNHRFYGSINKDIMSRFFEESSSVHEDRLIVGRTGKDFFEGRRKAFPSNFLIFQHDTPPKIEVESFLRVVNPYERIFVYYPRFVTMLSQKVDRLDIAYYPKEAGTHHYQQIKYIFEPELPKILAFFQNHIRRILFNRVLLETQLARTATRLISMDSAERNAEALIKITKANLAKAKQSLINRRLLETFAIVQEKHRRI